MDNNKDLNKKGPKHEEIMKFLLEQGPVNLLDKNVEVQPAEEKIPEMLARENSNLQVLEYLLNHAKTNPDFKVHQIGETIVTENTAPNTSIQDFLDTMEANPHLWKNTFKLLADKENHPLDISQLLISNTRSKGPMDELEKRIMHFKIGQVEPSLMSEEGVKYREQSKALIQQLLSGEIKLDTTDTHQPKIKGLPEIGVAPNKVKDMLAILRDNPSVDVNAPKPK